MIGILIAILAVIVLGLGYLLPFMSTYVGLLSAVLVLGFGYALLPQIYSFGLDDREPMGEGMQTKKLREEKEKWIQGILDLDTEWEVGNLEEEEYRSLRKQYKRNASQAKQSLKKIEQDGQVEDVEQLEESIEASIEEKQKQLSNQNK